LTAKEVDLESLRRKLEESQEAKRAAVEEKIARRYSLIRPMDWAADAYVRQVLDADRFFLGIPEIDMKTRGHGRKELTYVTGRRHHGKTQVMLNAVNTNSDKHVLFFTPDESPEIVLSKLIAIRYGVAADALEERIKVRDIETLDLIRHAAASDFRNLIVIDAGLTLQQMGQALDEAEDYWQSKCDVCLYDYLELLPGDASFSGVIGKSQAMKRWTNDADVPMICLHQGKRGEGNEGVAAGMDGMRYGGDSEAFMVLEVYRKRANTKLSESERRYHQDTVTVNIAKNKRPPMRLGEIDLYMNPETGHVRAATHADLVRHGAPSNSATELWRARKDTQ
jgi:replicative DNA helicase